MLNEVRARVRKLANPEIAEHSMRYFKTGPGQYGEGDQFVGIRMPVLRNTAREFKAMPVDEALELLQSGWHEERVLALLILIQHHERAGPDARLELHRSYLANANRVNNWDLVDVSAEHLAGPHLVPPDPVLDRLIASDDLWERRIAMVSTYHWIRQGEHGPAVHVAERLRNDNHDLIHKAVGWMLREVGKRDLPVLEEFLGRYYSEMPRTMLRYAIERLPEPRRKAYLLGNVPLMNSVKP